MIKFKNVIKVYKKNARPALDDVSVDIEHGEFVFLVGSSGSGKSTFLSLVIRAERANSGHVQVAGKDLGKLTNWKVPALRQQLGVVFQNFRLLQNKTVYENVAFALKVIGKSRHAIKTLVFEALKIVNLEDKAGRMPYELSGGEQQRVAIARAFVNRPLILLADEPTGNLDPATSQGIMRVLSMINKMGTTVVMATHSEEIVNSMKKRVIELHNGKVIRDEKNAGYIASDDTALEEENVETSDEIPSVDIVHNSTLRIPKLRRKTLDDNTTTRIPKMARLNEFALDGNLDVHNYKDDDIFEQYYDESDDLFTSGAFDTSALRHDSTSLTGSFNEEGENED
ncbi:MAG: cell division ATP-binding protein FtsE [Candidatus Ancillula sp.]|jgi:cell division transport system ATP-binding protein|nr:cell division ATP-binding protein FtsE [Candidatus Ancillula sp.]